MIARLLGPAWTQIQRPVRNGKLAILCLFLTDIMFHLYLGAGKFGKPEKDLGENRETVSYVGKRRLLEEASVAAAQGQQKAGSGNNNYADFDITKILRDGDDGVPEFKRDASQPYSLGLKISDWDEQRAEWLKKNPKFPNYITENKPRVLLVTGSSPKPCENPVGDHYLLKSIKNKIDYCRVHGIEIFYNMALLDAEMSGFWAKLPLIRK